MATIYHRPELAASLTKSLIHPSVLEEGLRSGLFLSGLRRVGKTTFLRMDLIPALEAAGVLVIYVDLWTDITANPALLIQTAIRSALAELQTPKSAVLKQLKSVKDIKGVNVSIAGFKFGFTLDSVGVRGGTTMAQALTAVVDQAKTDLVFIVDEVQQAISSEDGNAMLLALKAARDAINQRPDTSGYFLFVGTGSHRTLVSELTTRRNQAFVGAVSRPFPVLGRDYVKHLLARMRADGTKPLPSLDATVKAFGVLGYRPEELKKAMESLAASFPTGGNVDQIFGVVVQTLRTAAADLEIYLLENLGALAEAVFQRLATASSGAKGVFSTEAAADYGRFVERPVHVEEIQPVVNALLGANLIMRLGHGAYVVTDSFVQEVWKERTQDGGRRVSPTAGGMSRKPPALSPTPRRKKRSKN